MFSKSKINEPGPKETTTPSAAPAATAPSAPSAPVAPSTSAAPVKPKPPASLLSSDLVITGNLKTSGDIQIEGTVKGDIRAHSLTVGESARIDGEVLADDVVVNGYVKGRVRGLKVRLTSSARVEGDIIHKTIAIESGAHFEGTVQRQEDPLSSGAKSAPAPAAKPAAAAAEPEKK